MTGQLRTTLNARAHDLEAWEADLDAIVRDGARRVRRRRVAIAGGLAGVLAVVGGTAALATRGHTTRPQPAGQDVRPLSYAVGSVIHTGSGTIDVGKKVVSYVPTHWGFVFSTPDRDLYLERDGEVRPITTFDGTPSHLATDTSAIVVGDDGMLTAWFDGSRIQTWPGYRTSDSDEVDALDKTNSFNAADSWPADQPPRIEAVSDGHMWFWDGRETWVAAVRPSSSTAGWPDSGFPTPDTVQDAAGDKILVRVGDGLAVTEADLAPQSPTWDGGTDLSGVEPQVPGLSTGDLAPDGEHWFSHDNDEFAVFDSATGQRQEPAHPAFAFAAPYQWLGDGTMAVLATKGTSDDPQIWLLTCRVSTNDCEVAAPHIGGYDDVALPVGVPIGS